MGLDALDGVFGPLFNSPEAYHLEKTTSCLISILFLCLFALLPHADAAVDRALEVLSSRLPVLIFEEVALDTRDIQETPALDPQVPMVVLFNISIYSSNVMLSVTSYYPPLRILCNIKEREGSYYRGGRSSPNTFSL